jgi:hypothetical protein
LSRSEVPRGGGGLGDLRSRIGLRAMVASIGCWP